VLAVQVAGLDGAQEELAAVGVGSCIGHREDSGAGVLQGEVFILELIAIDRLATGAVVVGEVSTLAHESRDDPVERGSLESETLLPSAESSEVLSGPRNDIFSESHGDPAERGAISRDVEETIDHREEED